MSLLQHCSRIWPSVMALQRCCHTIPTHNLKNIDEAPLRQKLRETEAILKHATTLYRPDEVMLCFNGGKDCTVLLDVLSRQRNDATLPLHAMCVNSHDPFEEMEQFIDTSLQRYPIKLHRYNGALKLAVEQVIVEHPQVRAMFLGCRRSDPGCAELSSMTPCDNGWPSLMRIFPLLDWSYHDIWSYLRSQKLAYCSLYDQGYTSLGERSSTRLNPSLLAYDEQLGKLIYRPAYELKDDTLERANREDTQLVNRTRQHHQNP
ncbi:hypothetical protein KR093_005287 [Drosophila rubida]|uniref:FAD synthase n=1 Tax=Drosophila rubida TaxID=30044 RepID=A0AAD4PMV4_9MUSC|nr:hypothetical protein KR093_005287 [Drosophila rubida]